MPFAANKWINIERGMERVALYDLEGEVSRDTEAYARGAVRDMAAYVAMCSTDPIPRFRGQHTKLLALSRERSLVRR